MQSFYPPGNAARKTGRVTVAPAQAAVGQQEVEAKKVKHLIKVVAITLGIVVVLFSIATFVIGPYQVQGVSMQPNFRTGNVVLVWEWPQTWARLTGGQYVPARSSVVVIKKTPVLGEQLIKRVIGVPGDRVVINNSLVVYNNARMQGFNPDQAPYGKNLQPPQGTFNTLVGDGQVFVMGDNREPGASIDSRSSLGNVPSDKLIGKVVLRIWPLNKITLF